MRFWESSSNYSRVAVMAAASFKLLTTGTLLLALAIAIAANPVVEQKPITLPLTKHRSLVSYNIVESDQRRLDSLWRRAAYQDNSESDLDSRTSNIPATFGITYYSVSIGVGEPSTNCKWLQQLGISRWRNSDRFPSSQTNFSLTLEGERAMCSSLYVRLKWFFFTARTLG